MAAWLAPALKAVLPHLGAIVSAVAPAFTRKKADAVANQMQVLQDQIAELQSAASQNAAHIGVGDTTSKHCVGPRTTASIAEAGLRLALRFSVAAIALSAIGLG
jgi:hypothetical protein